jgi:biotin transporter BioY
VKKYPDFFSVLIGPSLGFLLGYIVIAFICAGAIVLYDISKRDISSPRTPEKINIKFWFADNLARVMANFILIPIAIRLCYQYVNPTWMLALACGIGFGIDGLGMIAKNSGILTTSKLAQRIKERIDKA